MGPIGAQILFSSLYKLVSNFLWIRETKKMYITPNFSNRKIVQNYRFCIFEGVSKHDLLHSTGHKSLKIGSKYSKIKQVGEFKQIQEILSKIGTRVLLRVLDPHIF